MKKFKPLLLTLFILIVDQISKSWVVVHIPENTLGYSLFGGFLDIIHVRNNAVAFSIGNSLSLNIRAILFILVPIIVLIYIANLIITDKSSFELNNFQRWILAGFLGGGLGNLIDRIFRGFRVVDFMSNRVYGLFGLERWPTWNLADASVCVSGVLLLISIIIEERKAKNIKK
ncbi:MAG: signal peptidase II [Spirochaetaceae bacterium]|nr:signal peptidase II [Spirochaetaceae bacterium]